MFVKICGITDPADAVAAAEAGADAIGLNFTLSSRRHVSVDQARIVAAEIPPDVLTVGIFRDHLASEVIDIAGEVGLDAAQLHGSETPATSQAVHAAVPLLIRAMSAEDPELPMVGAHGADALLLDAPVPGSGIPFDWSLVGDLTARHRVILAGGLRPETVADAIGAVAPWGVDVASGIEGADGRKDHDAIRRFVTNAREAAATLTDVHPPLAAPRNRA